ncbi:hypothetical protein [Aureimonas sp. SK2]|uniref:hypothetical protein n=1 Tax=Aureimonas sp. SK2 TaxID=3015992 RepID=UPI002443EA4A|nr:hypothetical protein [Aureimonas sp. SK2]
MDYVEDADVGQVVISDNDNEKADRSGGPKVVEQRDLIVAAAPSRCSTILLKSETTVSNLDLVGASGTSTLPDHRREILSIKRD